jgi:hypothetical protein
MRPLRGLISLHYAKKMTCLLKNKSLREAGSQNEMTSEYDHIYNSVSDRSINDILDQVELLHVSEVSQPYIVPKIEKNETLGHVFKCLPREILAKILKYCDRETGLILMHTTSIFLFEILFHNNPLRIPNVQDLLAFIQTIQTNAYLAIENNDATIKIIATERKLKDLIPNFKDLQPKPFKLGTLKRFVVNANIHEESIPNSIQLLRLMRIGKGRKIMKCSEYGKRNMFKKYHGAKNELECCIIDRLCFKKYKKNCLCREGQQSRYVCDVCLYGCCNEAKSDSFYVDCPIHKTCVQVFATS